MKLLLSFFLFLSSLALTAQTGLYNAGNLQLHEGNMGFHTHLINDGTFDQNQGLIGFYGNNTLTVSGAFMPVFHDMELFNPAGLLLETAVGVRNTLNFVEGDVLTPRNLRDIYLNFFTDAIPVNERDVAKINGYAASTDQSSFVFPVGDEAQLRPLTMNAEAPVALAKSAYFLEDPNNPSAFPISFDTSRKSSGVNLISVTEFWALEGNVPTTITLRWNPRSNLRSLTDDVTKIGLVGWNYAANSWVDLGNVGLSGDLANGFVTSESFVPDDYAVITFGSLPLPTDVLTLDNYYLTPNGDGTNDFLVIPEMADSPNNSIQIFDRFGLKVFEMENYTNEFNGFPNVANFVVDEKQGLPAGVYFYLVSLKDLEMDFQGFLYLRR
ncbi:MAG: gliding motility-associated C-terminal domain-containing protein [Sediminicola sp.]|tara:strand:- start:63386 stop:64531 length:1146 start_codon:yes stop_codon:yes gene_type:complete